MVAQVISNQHVRIGSSRIGIACILEVGLFDIRRVPPLGPKVSLTVLASLSIPASSPCKTCLS